MNVKKFFNLILQFSAPLGSVVLMVFGSAFFTTFLSLYMNQEGYTKSEIGYVHSAYYLGMLVGAFRMEKLIKRVGHIQALAVFGSLATSVTLLQAVFTTLPAWIFFRFLVGLSLAALYIVIESWMLHFSTIKTRGVVLSLYMMSLYIAQSASQQFLNFLAIHTLTPFILSAIFTSLSVIPVGLSTNRFTLPPSHETINYRKVFRTSPFGITGCFVSGLLLSPLYSFFPLFALFKGIQSENLMSLTIAGGVLLQWPLGWLSDIFERRKTLLFTIVSAFLLSLALLFYDGYSPYVILALSFVIGGFLFTLYPLSITQVCDHFDHSQVTTVTACLLVFYGLGCVIGPFISSIMIDLYGINILFLYYAIMLFGLGSLGTYSMVRRPIVPLPEQGEFVPLPSVTPVAYEMDPRGNNH